jgi:hypothetical protein
VFFGTVTHFGYIHGAIAVFSPRGRSAIFSLGRYLNDPR